MESFWVILSFGFHFALLVNHSLRLCTFLPGRPSMVVPASLSFGTVLRRVNHSAHMTSCYSYHLCYHSFLIRRPLPRNQPSSPRKHRAISRLRACWKPSIPQLNQEGALNQLLQVRPSSTLNLFFYLPLLPSPSPCSSISLIHHHLSTQPRRVSRAQT